MVVLIKNNVIELKQLKKIYFAEYVFVMTIHKKIPC
jgi:hypothetical protein